MNHSRSMIAVTGGRGRLGTAIIQQLLDKGYQVVSIDVTDVSKTQLEHVNLRQEQVDLNKYDEVVKSLEGVESVIHMAAYPDPHCQPTDVVFSNNTVSTYNVLSAAEKWGIQRAVIASSESAYGFPWAIHPFGPQYVPVDESHPLLPQDGYGLSKAVNEATADAFHRKCGMQVVSLRLSTICDEAVYKELLSSIQEPATLQRVLWSYVDLRDAATAAILAIERGNLGSVRLNICADDSCSNLPSAELLRRYLPELEDIREPMVGYRNLYSNTAAKQLLGWYPQYGWRGTEIDPALK